jgi:hypothetical protein
LLLLPLLLLLLLLPVLRPPLLLLPLLRAHLLLLLPLLLLRALSTSGGPAIHLHGRRPSSRCRPCCHTPCCCRPCRGRRPICSCDGLRPRQRHRQRQHAQLVPQRRKPPPRLPLRCGPQRPVLQRLAQALAAAKAVPGHGLQQQPVVRRPPGRAHRAPAVVRHIRCGLRDQQPLPRAAAQLQELEVQQVQHAQARQHLADRQL